MFYLYLFLIIQYYICENNRMKDDNNLFYDVIIQMRNNSNYQSLIQHAYFKYDLKASKINELSLKAILKKYQQIIQKYQEGIYDRYTIHWYQNQKRLFIWFALCYSQTQQTQLENLDEDFFVKISKIYFFKPPSLLKYQLKNIYKNNKQKRWTQNEDQLLTQSLKTFGLKKWYQVSIDIFVQSQEKYFRTGRQCRQRWFNHLDQRKIHSNWSLHQDLKLLNYVLLNGKKWSKICNQLNQQRTDHMIKNRFRALMKHLKNSSSSQPQKISMLIQHIKKLEKQGQVHQKQSIPIQVKIKSSQDIFPSILYFLPLDDKTQYRDQSLNINILGLQNSNGFLNS